MITTQQVSLFPAFAQPSSSPFKQVNYLAIQIPALFTLIEQIGNQAGVFKVNTPSLKNLRFEAESSYNVDFRESITAYFKRFEQCFVYGKTADYMLGGYNPNWAGSYARREQQLDLPQVEASSEPSSSQAEQMKAEEIPLPDLASIKIFEDPEGFLQAVDAIEESAAEKVLEYMKTPKMQNKLEKAGAHDPKLVPTLKTLAWRGVTEKLVELLLNKAKFSLNIVDVAYKMGHRKLALKLIKSNATNNDIAHTAALNGNLATLELLAGQENEELKPLLTKTNNNGDNIAHTAAMEGQLEVLKWLADQENEELKALLTETNHGGNSIALTAAMKSQLTVLEWLAGQENEELKALLTETDYEGDNLAHRAAYCGHPVVLDWIAGQESLRHLLTETADDGANIAYAAAMGGRAAVLDWIAQQENEELKALLTATNNLGNNLAQASELTPIHNTLEWLGRQKRDLRILLAESDILEYISQQESLCHLLTDVVDGVTLEQLIAEQAPSTP